MILHTVNKSVFSQDTLGSCLRLIIEGDVLLLIEDGVYAILTQHPLAAEIRNCQERNIAVYALTADVLARGLKDRVPDHIALCDDAGFVELCCQTEKTQSWY